jgi:hypothetical protein
VVNLNLRAENERLTFENLEQFDTVTQLEDQLQELHEVYIESMQRTRKAEQKYDTLEGAFNEEMTLKQRPLVEKMLHLTSLVEEYERIMTKYISLTSTNLTTTKLQQLRKQGGYLP